MGKSDLLQPFKKEIVQKIEASIRHDLRDKFRKFD